MSRPYDIIKSQIFWSKFLPTLAYVCNELLMTFRVRFVDACSVGLSGRHSARIPRPARRYITTCQTTFRVYQPPGSLPPLCTAIQAEQMTSKLAINDTNEHLWMNATPTSWRWTGRAPDVPTLYSSTSAPRLTHHKLLYAIAFTAPNNRPSLTTTRHILHFCDQGWPDHVILCRFNYIFILR